MRRLCITLLCVLGVGRSLNDDPFGGHKNFDPEINFKNKKELHAEIPDGLVIEGINDYDSHTMTPLLNAVQACHVEAVRQLLRGGADTNMNDGEGNSPLLVASDRGYYEIASMLLDHHADVSVRNIEGRTALYAASQGGHVEVVRLLLANGAQVDAVARAGMTPLMVAALKGYSRVVEALLSGGANPNATNNGRENALLLAAISPVAGTSVDVGADGEVQNTEEKDALQLLVEAGGDINAADIDGKTALIKVAVRGHGELVRRLVEAGADVDIKDSIGKTALTYASELNQHEVAQFLLSVGAEIQGRYGPRMEASTRRKREEVLRARREEEMKRLGLVKEPEPVTLKKSP